MASSVVNRQTIRERLASKIDAALNSDWDVFNYGTSEFNGKARNVIVASADTAYPEMGAGSDSVAAGEAEFDFGIGIFILYSNASLSWTAQNSEDALDLGRKLITDVIRDNRVDGSYWDRLEAIGRSRVGIAEDLAGVPYRYEVITVRASNYL